MRVEFSQKYADLAKWHWWFRGRALIIEAILRRHLDGGAKHILSIGCGPVEALTWLLRVATPEGSVTGLDINSSHGPSTGDILFVTGSAERPPFPDCSFDVVLALDILEHLPNDELAVCNALRVLKPGGLLVISVPAFPLLWGRQDIVSEHCRRYVKRNLSAIVRRSGFGTFEISYFNVVLFPAIAALRLGRRLIGTAERPASDFDGARPGLLNTILLKIFGAERHVIGRLPTPFGLSLLAVCVKDDGDNRVEDADNRHAFPAASRRDRSGGINCYRANSLRVLVSEGCYCGGRN